MMIEDLNSRKRAEVRTIGLDTSKCVACWKCVESCAMGALGKINLPWHKHAVIVSESSCIGCLKCMNVCDSHALFKVDLANNGGKKIQRRGFWIRLRANLGLLLAALVVVFSGFLIQFCYHVGHGGEINKLNLVLGLTYVSWTLVHKLAVLLLSFYMGTHIYKHRKWFVNMLLRRTKTKTRGLVWLTIMFFITFLTGYCSWLVDLAGGDMHLRKAFIEIHDKVTIFFFGMLLWHVYKKFRGSLTKRYKI